MTDAPRTVTVPLPFELTREHMLLLRAAERKMLLVLGAFKGEFVRRLSDARDQLEDHGCVGFDGEYCSFLTPLGRAILEQCPLQWGEAELEAKLREMAG